MAVADFYYIRSEFRICCKSLQNAPECLKCVMIGLSCKWSLTFHYMSCLSSLMATAPWSYYIRAIYSCLIWLAHSGNMREKFGAKGLRVMRITPYLLISGLCGICQRGRGRSFQCSHTQPECVSCLGKWLPSCLLAGQSIGDWSQRTPSWDISEPSFPSTALGWWASAGNGLTHWRGDTAGLHDAALRTCQVLHKFNQHSF